MVNPYIAVRKALDTVELYIKLRLTESHVNINFNVTMMMTVMKKYCSIAGNYYPAYHSDRFFPLQGILPNVKRLNEPETSTPGVRSLFRTRGRIHTFLSTASRKVINKADLLNLHGISFK